MRSFAFAAVLGAALAIKQDPVQQDAALTEEWDQSKVDFDANYKVNEVAAEGNAQYRDTHVRLDAKDWSQANADELKASLDEFVKGELMEKANWFKDSTVAVAWHEEQMEKGELMETCAAGQKCREEAELDISTKIDEKWNKLVEKIGAEVIDVIDETRVLVEEGWVKFQKCEEENPCCEVNEVVWKNLQINIKRVEDSITAKYLEWDTLQAEIDFIDNFCEPRGFQFEHLRINHNEIAPEYRGGEYLPLEYEGAKPVYTHPDEDVRAQWELQQVVQVDNTQPQETNGAPPL